MGLEPVTVPPRTRTEPPPRILLQDPRPALDGGRYPVKACVGDAVAVSALVLRDGHDLLRAAVLARGPGGGGWIEAPLEWTDRAVDGDRWAGSFSVDRVGRWEWTIVAWTDVWATWRDELARKAAAGQADLSGELSEGALLLEDAAGRAEGEESELIVGALAELTPAAALSPALDAAMERSAERHGETRLAEPLGVEVERVRARFGAWYELFPRSWGGFAGVTEVLPRLAELGFDVLYLPPIHPIGETNRKGRNGALTAGPTDPGSPWAIGDPAGGHDALHPDLGTPAQFDAMVAAGRKHGVELALDFAIQCSADHPWLTEHPEWFHRRPDGTLKYAENPPKRYQDIYNVNWESPDRRGLWDALRDVLLGWIRRGVKVFRVDNPHTKPFAFWEWLLAEARAEDPDVIFLSEAFTREARMRALGKLGFSQSYTYFTWKNTAHELYEYVSHLVTLRDELRPNFFANTPDILHEYLQSGGPPAFHARAVLAATLSPSYGIYSGFESYEHVPIRPGSEEYEDSEKYEAKARALDGPLLPVIATLNALRRAHPALQRIEAIEFLPAENDVLLAYAKVWEEDVVLIAVNTDPHHRQEGVVVVPAHLALPPAFGVRDALSGAVFTWQIGRNFVALEPGGAHVLELA